MPTLTQIAVPGDARRLSDAQWRIAQRTRLLTLALAFWAPVFVVIYLWLGCQKSATIVAIAGFILVVNLHLLRRGMSKSVSANVTLGDAFVTFTALAMLNTGHYSPPSLWYAVVPLMAVWLLDLRAGVCWAAACAVAISGFYFARQQGFTFQSTLGEPEMRFLEFSGLLGLVLCLFGLACFNRKVEKSSRELLAESLSRAENADRARCAFFAGVSHELRTPLTSVMGALDRLHDVLGRDGASDGHGLTVDIARRNVQRIVSIVDDLLEAKQIASGQATVERSEMNLRRLVEDVVSTARPTAVAKGLHLQTTLDASLPMQAYGSPDRLVRILANLTDNAIKFTSTGRVDVTASVERTEDGSPLFVAAITDTGVGMSPEQLNEIHREYLQPGAPFDWRPGAACFGLMQASRLAAALRGRITVESSPGVGSTFTMMIPIFLAPEPSQADRRSLGQAERKAETLNSADLSNALEGLRILYAEDSPDIQRVMAYMLEKAGASRVEVVENGKQAIERMTEGGALSGPLLSPSPFDVVLMDMRMPELSGYEATAQLRALGYSGPIIAVTAYAMAGDREKCLLAGCSDYLPKPIIRERLLETILRQTSRRKVKA